MKQLHAVLAIAVLLLAPHSAAWAQPSYRVIPIVTSDEASFADLNDRGEVVGTRIVGGMRHAFRWRNSVLTDLHGVIALGTPHTSALGTNNRSAIVGVSFDFIAIEQAFVLRGTQAALLPLVPGELRSSAQDINDRGQIIASSSGGPEQGSFFVDRGEVELLPGLPDGFGTMLALSLNDLGAVTGHSQSATGSHAVLWQHGEITDLGVVPGASSSIGVEVNNRNQVAGNVSIAGVSAAFLWQRGTMRLLPKLADNVAASSASSINDFGVIVGSSTTLSPAFQNIATLWLHNRASAIHDLIGDDDPLKPFLELLGAHAINDRGDIVVLGADSRTPTQRGIYFLRLR